MPGSRGKVLCAMSGGVDSSVAAALLLREGYEVVGCFMRLGNPEGVELAETCDSTGKVHKQGCCSVNDANDARRVAAKLGIGFYVLNFEQDFSRVIDYFTREYNAGRTPNPCVRCNDWLKYGKLAEYAAAIDADYVASGHYARIGIDPASGENCLMRGVDHAKDQSYVLFGISGDRATGRAQPDPCPEPACGSSDSGTGLPSADPWHEASRFSLDHTLLPVGGYTKPQIRAMAEEWDLPVFNKPDSQEICFVPDQDYRRLLERRGAQFEEGEVVDTAGRVIGTHGGHQRYTVGQRRGVRLALGRPVYVVGVDAAENRVIVGDREDLLANGLVADQINLIAERAAGAFEPLPCQAKIRYNAQPVGATLRRLGDDRIHVTFDEPQSAVTPGQAVCLYDGDVVLGGGWIERAEK